MIFPASTNGGGQAMTPGPTDVCKIATPGGPVPTPMPCMTMLTQAKGSSCSSKVKFGNKKVCTTDTETSMSTMDEAGLSGGGGVVSSRAKGPCKFKKGSGKVKAQGKPVVHATSLIGMNGSNPNMPAGVQMAPSQTRVKVSP